MEPPGSERHRLLHSVNNPCSLTLARSGLSQRTNERSLMLTSQKVMDAINEQIGYEFSASMQYYAIAAHFAEDALPQLSAHFFQQAEEEKEHALRFIKYGRRGWGRRDP